MSEQNTESREIGAHLAIEIPASLISPLVHASNVRDAMRETVKVLSVLLGADMCFLYPPRVKGANLPAAVEYSRDSIDAKQDEVAVEFLKVLNAMTVVDFDPIVVEDVLSDPQMTGINAHCRALNIQALICVKCSITRDVTSTVVVCTRAPEPGWSEDDLRLLQTVLQHYKLTLKRLFESSLLRESEETSYRQALDAQSKKVKALYTVSSAIRGYLDPAHIASRGLTALCDATGADAGFCCLFSEAGSGPLSIIAHHGFSAEFPESLDGTLESSSPLNSVAASGSPIVIDDLRLERTMAEPFADEQGMRSAVLVPVFAEDEVLGGLALFSKSVNRFDGADVMLVSACANQIGLAARQSNLFAAYRKQTKNITALYRMTRELSGSDDLAKTFQIAFSVLRDELGLKRLWLGLLNETGTRLVGQAAYGSGWKRQLVEMNVEIKGRENPIAKVVDAKKALVLDEPESLLREFGVRRIFSRLAIHSVVLVPLMANSQVLGVLAVQPDSREPNFDDSQLDLLCNLANEIASAVRTKRLEERVGESEKMRAAGLLAAGIAHNFNNLLQAILGQASLLELQGESNPRVQKAVKIINTAAYRGADLVRQLLSIAHLEEPRAENCNVNDILRHGEHSFRNLLKAGQHLAMNVEDQLPQVKADPSHVKRIVSNLISNAVEALEGGGEVEIFTNEILITDSRPHFEVPNGNYVRIGVRDSGRGMSEEIRRRCFEPFFTTKDVDPRSGVGMTGAGLGLAAAYALARKNGGRLVAEGRPGHGSVFTLYVPVAPILENVDEGTMNRGSALTGAIDVVRSEMARQGARIRPRRVRSARGANPQQGPVAPDKNRKILR